jgi:phage repressor protein C with HTH and peptisase S24 domain
MSREIVEKIILEIRHKYGLKNDGEVAAKLGVSRQMLHNYKVAGQIPQKYLNPIGIDMSDDKLSMPAEIGKLPVVGIAQAGPGIFSTDGDYPPGDADEYISRPHGIKDTQAFGIIVKDRSMMPAFRNQQRVVVSPNVQVENSDRVVVGLKDGKRLIAEWHKKDGHVELVKYNADNIVVEFDDIEFAYKIVWSREL